MITENEISETMNPNMKPKYESKMIEWTRTYYFNKHIVLLYKQAQHETWVWIRVASVAVGRMVALLTAVVAGSFALLTAVVAGSFAIPLGLNQASVKTIYNS